MLNVTYLFLTPWRYSIRTRQPVQAERSYEYVIWTL